uniref:ATP synthase F0 subunit 8 n=1 Tax=Sperchon plumifer TaxID=2047715 RepID=A0A3G1VW85_9ACAR|nr:ATP synthase F0 subunit 8 [Sperchon plumifer]AYK28781.1 ATP synthase F0 subunit 8 [Sperchon plumifer]
MPQTSPMNWMIITMMFFITMNIIISKSKTYFKSNIQTLNSVKMKNIMWKW